MINMERIDDPNERRHRNKSTQRANKDKKDIFSVQLHFQKFQYKNSDDL